MNRVAIIWPQDNSGTITLSHGRLISPKAFNNVSRLLIEADEEQLGPSAFPTMVTATTAEHAFTFLLRDVHAEAPIWIPAYEVAVTEEEDARTYAEIAEAVRMRHSQTALQRIASDPEESYEHSAATTRDMPSPTWLGLSRDMRLFELMIGSGVQSSFTVSARDHGNVITLPATELTATYHFAYGIGEGCIELEPRSPPRRRRAPHSPRHRR